MAAGLGFKTFTTGEVLTAGDTNGYLMQGIWVFANATARDAAVTSPQEGNACYLKDTNEVQTYSGTAWVAVGGASGGMTLLSTTTFSGSSTVISSISQSYKQLFGIFVDVYGNTADTAFSARLNGDTGNNYMLGRVQPDTNPSGFVGENRLNVGGMSNSSTSTRKAWGYFQLLNYTSTGTKIGMSTNAYDSVTYAYEGNIINNMAYFGGSAVTSITFFPASGSFTDGTFLLYGVS